MKAIFLLLIFTGCFQSTQAQDHARQTLDTVLIGFKKEDNLRDWLYARIAYNAEKPGQRLPFLMSTESETWRKPQTNQEIEGWLNLLINQGYYQLYAGNVLKSIEEYEKAYSYYKRYPIENYDLVEYIFKPLGNNYTRLGDYTNAIFIQKKSLRIAAAKHDKLAIASIYSNLAISYKSMGELHEAENLCRNGFKYLAQKHPVSGLLYSTLADIEYEKGEYAKASKSVASALNILSKNKSVSSPYWLLSAYTLAGNIEQKKHNFLSAHQYYSQGLQVTDLNFKGSRKREKANLLIQLGNILVLQNKAEQALNLYNQALQILIPDFQGVDYGSLPSVKKLYSENRLYDVLEGRGNALLLLNKQGNALDNYLLAMATGDKSRNEFADAADRLYYQKQSKNLAEKAIATAYDLWIKTHHKKYSEIILGIAEQTKARTLLDQIQQNQRSLLSESDPHLKERQALKRAMIYYEKEYLQNNENKILLNNLHETQYKLAILDKKIKKKYPAWNKTDALESIPVGKLLKQIPDQFGIINFFWGEKNVFIIKAEKGKIDTIIQLRNAGQFKTEIDHFVQFYFKQGPEAMINNPEGFYNSSYQIFQKLLSNSFEGKQQKKTLIIPDDILGYLPFESLITSARYSESIAKWPFLIKRASVSYAYSLQSWLSSSLSKPTGNTFSGFFIAKNEGGIPIPAVAVEAEKLEEQLKGAYYIDKKAAIAPFKQALNTANVLHLSTHSFMLGSSAEPALQLADGKFFLFELSAQTRVPNLMVLSACRTADGIMASGEGVLSLSRGFTAAGTKGVVAGLWNINDEASSQLIISFYENLQNGQDAAMSLHQAKIDWLKRKHNNPALLLPYYWGSLIYIGKPQIVSLENADNYTMLYGALLGIPLVVLAGYLFRRRRGKF